MSSIIRDPRLGLVWLAVRLWVGWEFLDAGWQKTFGSESSAWWGSSAGVHGFLSGAGSSASTAGAHAAVPQWYASVINRVFLHADGFFAVAIPLGELLVGVGLILGLFTMVSAFFAALMNLSYLLAGSTGGGLNPEMFGLGLLIMFAGPAAYVYGVDRIVLPRLKAILADKRRPTTRVLPIPLAPVGGAPLASAPFSATPAGADLS